MRCHETMLPGQPVQLDHDDDDPSRYLGYSHRSCNARAGAIAGNKARAAAYNALKGAILSPPANGSAGIISTRVEGNRAAHELPDVALGTVRERTGGGWERWSGDDGWVRVSCRW